ncbi:MAG TPA: Na+/H+ antiporter NhaA [Euzebyales bacterium]|nr:Na+/H+ antiporter NhaA [Euzebyales bacterium]
MLHPWTSYVIIPVFALANAGLDLSAVGLDATLLAPIAVGVLLGLLVGKPVGVTAGAWIATRLTRTPLPVACLGGSSPVRRRRRVASRARKGPARLVLGSVAAAIVDTRPVAALVLPGHAMTTAGNFA